MISPSDAAAAATMPRHAGDERVYAMRAMPI